MSRIRQGLSEVEALREWARRADIDPLYRLVSVLSLNREASDLGRLISEEARSMRRDAQRELVEAIERRSQQVWIPVHGGNAHPRRDVDGCSLCRRFDAFRCVGGRTPAGTAVSLLWLCPGVCG